MLLFERTFHQDLKKDKNWNVYPLKIQDGFLKSAFCEINHEDMVYQVN